MVDFEEVGEMVEEEVIELGVKQELEEVSSM